MALTAEPADPLERSQHHLPPKSYADAAEEALSLEDDQYINEATIKETPPRPQHIRHTSEPRPLGEVMDEIERSSRPNSPLLRHPRGRLENQQSHESWSDIAKSSPSPAGNRQASATAGANGGTPKRVDGAYGNGNNHANGAKKEKNTSRAETFDGVGEDQEPRTPTRKSHRRTSSRSTNGINTKHLRPDSFVEGSEDGDDQSGSRIYESKRNKSGENLASVDLSMAPREDNTKSDAVSKAERHKRQSSLVSGRRAGAGWSRSAIHWAPLNVPLQRRLQTLLVLLHTISIVGFLAFFFLICAIPLMWPLVVPYLIYLTFSRAAVDGKLAHRSEWLRSSRIWSLFGAYYPARLHRSEPLEPTRKYVFGYHPHGIISHGAFAAFATEALGFKQLFPGITNTLLTLDANFSIPLYRDWALRLGLASVSRESCENLL